MSRKYSQSGVKLFKRCPKQYEYNYIQKLKSKKPAAKPSFGSLFHLFAAAFNTRKGLIKGTLQQEPVIRFPRPNDEEEAALYIDNIETLSDGELLDEMIRLYQKNFWDFLWDDIKDEFNANYNGDFLGHCREVFFQWAKIEPDICPVFVEKKVQRNEFTGIVDLVYTTSPESEQYIQRDYKTVNSYLSISHELLVTEIQHVLYSLLLPVPIAKSEYTFVSTILPAVEPRWKKDGNPYALRQQPWFSTQSLNPLISSEYPELLDRVDDAKFWFTKDTIVTQDLKWHLLADVLCTLQHIKHAEQMYEWTRSPSKQCEWDCPYKDLCVNEVLGYDTSLIRETHYVQG